MGAICDHAWTRRTRHVAQVAQIGRNLSGRAFARSANHRLTFAVRPLRITLRTTDPTKGRLVPLLRQRSCAQSSCIAFSAHLVHRPLVEPNDGRTDRLAVLAEEAERLALVRDCPARDARPIDLWRELAHRQTRRAPPVFGVLFEISWAQQSARECSTPISDRRAGPMPGNRLVGWGRGVDSDKQ